ncbi:uncharacterized protein LOC124443140 [Xenia sp. Carnegie-2017]|nr:uncharacterized protein LOC124443140 [Xenia sp. Carnegie-2017]
MHNSFVFVHRYPHLLLDGYGWILCCSCDANRKQFVEALPNNIQLDPQKESTSMMQSVFSDHSYHEMQPEEAMRMMQAILLIFLKKMVIKFWRHLKVVFVLVVQSGINVLFKMNGCT